MRVLGAENTSLLRDALFERSALLPGTLRSFAVDLAAIEAWLSGDGTFDHQAESWRAFGFTPQEAAQWKAAGVAQPAEAAARVLRAEQIARGEVC
jgi:hypothetical protein